MPLMLGKHMKSNSPLKVDQHYSGLIVFGAGSENRTRTITLATSQATTTSYPRKNHTQSTNRQIRFAPVDAGTARLLCALSVLNWCHLKVTLLRFIFTKDVYCFYTKAAKLVQGNGIEPLFILGS
jgi:hypothetical protein